MKRILALLLVAVLCLSLAACGDPDGNDNGSTGQPQESTAKQEISAPDSETTVGEETVEITLDNWQEYFEIRPSTHGPLYDDFGEKFKKLDYVCWAFFLKEAYIGKVTKAENLAVEYSFADGYCSWFQYHFDTEELVQGEPAETEDIRSFREIKDSARTLKPTLSSLEDGSFMVFIHVWGTEAINHNTYSFVGEAAYHTMEVTRIQGTLTITK